MSLLGSIGRRKARGTSRRGASCHEDGLARGANFASGQICRRQGLTAGCGRRMARHGHQSAVYHEKAFSMELGRLGAYLS
jgi:hypothetical protein